MTFIYETSYCNSRNLCHPDTFVFKIVNNYHLQMKIFLRDTICLNFPNKNFLKLDNFTDLIKFPKYKKCLNSMVWIKAWGVFLMFGRFGRKIFHDKFWPYVTSRKSLEVISFVFSDIFNFKYHKNTRNSRFCSKVRIYLRVLVFL